MDWVHIETKTTEEWFGRIDTLTVCRIKRQEGVWCVELLNLDGIGVRPLYFFNGTLEDVQKECEGEYGKGS